MPVNVLTAVSKTLSESVTANRHARSALCHWYCLAGNVCRGRKLGEQTVTVPLPASRIAPPTDADTAQRRLVTTRRVFS